MKKITIYLLCIAGLLAAAGCAKEPVTGPNDAAKRFMDAWIHTYNQTNGTDIKPSGLGIYVLEEKEGDSDKTVTDNGYAIVEFKTTDLKGNISAYTSAETAKQLGAYNDTYYYGPQVWLTMDATIQAGLQEAIVGMKVGGSKKVVIPSWLMTYSSYDDADKYLAKETSGSNAIYEFTVKDFTDSINVWQIDSIERYIVKNYGDIKSFSNDTTGFYYRQLSAPADDEKFASDTTIYINYTGRLLNGLVFDTNIERVAKDNGLYDPKKTYEPSSIKWGEKHGDLTMGTGSSTVISGFSLTLWQMKAMEKGIGIFYSPLGYGSSGSGSSIPAYSPLIFEIEIVEKPED